jgi:two-component system OmpR family sensor kinase
VGRLVWKFFAFNWGAQLAAISIGFFWLRAHVEFAPAPTLPGLVAVLATSFLSAAVLSWYFAKPIRSLRAGFTAAAAGDLSVKVEPVLAHRHDELADLGRDFDRMTARLREVLEGHQRLLHDVSHEMRSPLARLHAAIGLARQQPDRLDAHLERIELEAVRMDALVEELLTLARLQSGVGIALEEEVSVPELLTALVEDCDFEARARGGEVQLLAEPTPVVRGNSELLHRAIENVVRNAIKHGGAGRSVIVRSSCDRNRRSVRVLVLDSGPGVPEAQLEAIFEPFVNFDAGGSISSSGHGLGLTIARRIVATHGGTVTASNRAEGGLVVAIELPVLMSGVRPRTAEGPSARSFYNSAGT